MTPTKGSTPLGEAGLVAGREIRERLRSRIFKFGTVILVLGVAAAIIIPTRLHKGSKHTYPVGVVGSFSANLRQDAVLDATALGTSVQFVAEPSSAAADSDLINGRIDLAVLDGRQLVVKQAIGASDTSAGAELVRALANQLGTLDAYQSAGLSTAQIGQLSTVRALPVTSLRPASKSSNQATSVIGVILIFVMLTQYNTWILIGVMQEKASRVAEVLLAAVRPIQLLTGKVLGIGLVAMGQAALIVVVALGLAQVTGSDLLKGTGPAEVASALLWLVLGYSFYSWVYAAAGSMAERQDQVQTLAFPLSLPILLGYITSLTAASSAHASAFVKVLSFLPPTAPFAMTVRVGLGQVVWWEFVISAVLSVVATVAVARFAAAVYRRAILHSGSRMRVRQLLSRESVAR